MKMQTFWVPILILHFKLYLEFVILIYVSSQSSDLCILSVSKHVFGINCLLSRSFEKMRAVHKQFCTSFLKKIIIIASHAILPRLGSSSHLSVIEIKIKPLDIKGIQEIFAHSGNKQCIFKVNSDR